ncbi:hypothetical protein NDU88_001834 [Pleurodeles waltl]|uniref:Cytochrome c domain-containing protein n=1 Tax=Pleurodeles waltl TaxID=8319 RepID=A0AAV7TIX1_PLEWA|nr:hypothetical protein NDU88_001834 [Pleurodeles waltl]
MWVGVCPRLMQMIMLPLQSRSSSLPATSVPLEQELTRLRGPGLASSQQGERNMFKSQAPGSHGSTDSFRATYADSQTRSLLHEVGWSVSELPRGLRRAESASDRPLTFPAVLQPQPDPFLTSPAAKCQGRSDLCCSGSPWTQAGGAAPLAFSTQAQQGSKTLRPDQTRVSGMILAAAGVAGELRDAEADIKKPQGRRFTRIFDGPQVELELNVCSSCHLDHALGENLPPMVLHASEPHGMQLP